MKTETIARRLAAEFIGTAMLVASVVGSGIMAERLAGGNIAVALLANTVATGAALVALILTFAPVSGAHFNPAVSLAARLNHEMTSRAAMLYISVQIAGAIIGVMLANLMFDLAPLALSSKTRSGLGIWLGEVIAAFGLLGVIVSTSRRQKLLQTALAVAAFITAGYWFTSSTSFANPAVTIARSLTDTFTGIRPVDIPGFVIAQVVGAVAAAVLFNWLVPKES
jgi:glycerol uptake facilitator-like aquaporin